MSVQSFKGTTQVNTNQHPASAGNLIQVPVGQIGGGLASAMLVMYAAGPMVPMAPNQWGQPNSSVTLSDNDAGTVLFQDFSATLIFEYDGTKIVGISGGGREDGLDYAIEASVHGTDFIVEMHRATVPGSVGAQQVMDALIAKK